MCEFQFAWFFLIFENIQQIAEKFWDIEKSVKISENVRVEICRGIFRDLQRNSFTRDGNS